MPWIGYLDSIRTCRHADLTAFVPWHVGSEPVGLVHRQRVPLLLRPASPFRLVADRLTLAGDDFVARTDALAALIASLVAVGELRAPLGEMYPVFGGVASTPQLQLDRVAVTWFGVRAFGVHLNGYARSRDGPSLWIAVRSRQKRTFPGHLDNVVAGGQPIGLLPLQTLVKECDEEAGVGAELATQAVPTGTIAYVQQDGLSLKDDTLACFDLELPATFVPRPVDGEVEAFMLWPVAEVAASLRGNDLWKPNSAMVTLDFILRHGCLDRELAAAERWRLWQALHGAIP